MKACATLLLICLLAGAPKTGVLAADGGMTRMCDLNGGRFCITFEPRGIATPQFELTEGSPRVEVVSGARWRISYLKHPREVAVLLEQNLAHRTVWDFYLIGPKPNLRVRFETHEEMEIWHFANSGASGLHSCLPDGERTLCDTLLIFKQMLFSHLETGRGDWRMKPGIHQAFAYIEADCGAHLGYSCSEEAGHD